MNTVGIRAQGKAARKWRDQHVCTLDPHGTSAAALALLTRHYFILDKSIYSERRMQRVRDRWMKEQMKTPDSKGGLTCVLCGRKGLNPFTNNTNKLATLDHIIELKHGGSWNDSTNFRVACYQCNQMRG